MRIKFLLGLSVLLLCRAVTWAQGTPATTQATPVRDCKMSDSPQEYLDSVLEQWEALVSGEDTHGGLAFLSKDLLKELQACPAQETNWLVVLALAAQEPRSLAVQFPFPIQVRSTDGSFPSQKPYGSFIELAKEARIRFPQSPAIATAWARIENQGVVNVDVSRAVYKQFPQYPPAQLLWGQTLLRWGVPGNAAKALALLKPFAETGQALPEAREWVAAAYLANNQAVAAQQLLAQSSLPTKMLPPIQQERAYNQQTLLGFANLMTNQVSAGMPLLQTVAKRDGMGRLYRWVWSIRAPLQNQLKQIIANSNTSKADKAFLQLLVSDSYN